MVLEVMATLVELSVIGLTFFLKTPQIAKVLQARDATGLSVKSIALETWGAATIAAHTIRIGGSWLMCSQGALVVTQSVALLACVMHYQNRIDINSLTAFALFSKFQILLALDWLPRWLANLILASGNINIVLASSGKFMQLQMILEAKDASNVSLVSWVIATYITTVKFIGGLLLKDIHLITTFLALTFFNAAIAVSVWVYARPKARQAKGKDD